MSEVGAAYQVAKTGRRLRSYLLVPRPREALLQGLLPVWGYGIVHLAGAGDAGVTVGPALLAIAVFEVGLYQARYMLNDLADADVDQAHAAAAARGRPPSAPNTRRRMIQVIVLRLVVAAGVVAVLPGSARTTTAVAAAALVAATLVYEAARTPARRRTAIELQARPPTRLTPSEVAVYVAVGSGYALRFAFGVALAGAPGSTVALSVVFGCVYGMMIAVMVWTLEGANLRVAGSSRVLARKPHVGLLARLVGEDPDRMHQPLLAGPPARLLAGLVAAVSALAVAVATRLGDAPTSARLGMLLAVCVVASPLLLGVWPSGTAGAVAAGLNVLAAAMLASASARWATVALILLVSVMATVSRSLTIDDANRSFGRSSRKERVVRTG